MFIWWYIFLFAVAFAISKVTIAWRGTLNVINIAVANAINQQCFAFVTLIWSLVWEVFTINWIGVFMQSLKLFIFADEIFRVGDISTMSTTAIHDRFWKILVFFGLVDIMARLSQIIIDDTRDPRTLNGPGPKHFLKSATYSDRSMDLAGRESLVDFMKLRKSYWGRHLAT